MTESDRASDWLRYFKIVPKMSTLIAVKKNNPEVLQKVLSALGLASPLDVIEKCTGDDW